MSGIYIKCGRTNGSAAIVKKRHFTDNLQLFNFHSLLLLLLQFSYSTRLRMHALRVYLNLVCAIIFLLRCPLPILFAMHTFLFYGIIAFCFMLMDFLFAGAMHIFSL